jgi:hypothetical protein
LEIDEKVDLWTGGALIAIISIATFVVYSSWEEWLNFLVGIWLIISPWILGFAHTRAMHYSISIGGTVAFIAALEIWLIYDVANKMPSVLSRRQHVAV